MKILQFSTLLKLLKINYFSAFLGFGLLLEWVYSAKNVFLAEFLFFIFSIAVLRKFSRNFSAFILMLFFLISSIIATSIYSGAAAHFLIAGLSLSFLILIISFFYHYNSYFVTDSDKDFHQELYRLSKLLIVFFWFFSYFYDRFGGLIFRNFMSAILLYFVLENQIVFEDRAVAQSGRIRRILIFSLILIFLEIILTLNFLPAFREIKALAFSFIYLIVANLLLSSFSNSEFICCFGDGRRADNYSENSGTDVSGLKQG